jgi:hypothetical protein
MVQDEEKETYPVECREQKREVQTNNSNSKLKREEITLTVRADTNCIVVRAKKGKSEGQRNG